MSKRKETSIMNSKQFKEMCIRLGLMYSDTMKINYSAVAVLMSLGKRAVKESINKQYPHAIEAYEDDIAIIQEYIDDYINNRKEK